MMMMMVRLYRLGIGMGGWAFLGMHGRTGKLSNGKWSWGGIFGPEGCCYLRHLSGKLHTLHACTISLLLRSKEV
jgi:hypothetical protein